MTATTRNPGWDGFFNTRDLGGLSTLDGRTTRHGAFTRSADLRFVTPAGWASAYRSGIRTIVDLRNDDEIRPTAGTGPTAAAGTAQFAADPAGSSVPDGIQRIEVPLDDIDDVAFWQDLNEQGLNGTPLYYRPFLARKPERCAAVIATLAQAIPNGGVLFHCGAGRDRTGLVALLLLALAGATPAAIADDYTGTTAGGAGGSLRELCAALGRADPEPEIAALLAARGTTARDAVLDVLDGFDAAEYLRGAGVSATDLAILRKALAR